MEGEQLGPWAQGPSPWLPPVSAEDWTSRESSRAPVLLLHLLTIRHGSSHFILLRLTFIFYKPDPGPLRLAHLSEGQGVHQGMRRVHRLQPEPQQACGM